MLTDVKLRSQVDQLWDKLWTGGLANPMDAIEQFSYLLFFKRLDDEEDARQKQASLRRAEYTQRIPDEMRWRYWSKLTPAAAALNHVRDKVFPWFRNLGGSSLEGADNSFARYMQAAEFKINKASLLVEACSAIDQMQISQQNQDVQGDLYEYLLSKLAIAGQNGQFRTPRHIVRMMVQMINPQPYERVGDLAAGTCGFLINAYQHILEQRTSKEILSYDADGYAHNLVGDLLSDNERAFLQTKALRGFDNDSGMTMLRIGSMNLILHGVESPQFYYMDTLSKDFGDTNAYDVILMNPPFKGGIDKNEVSPTLPTNVGKTELLFLHLILRALDTGGRCAIIVPDGVLFGSSNAHKAIRKKILEENRLDGVVSMPGGVFKPYAGVSTAVLLFTKGASTGDEVWFYDMAFDGFSLDDKRARIADNDIPDILECWHNRHDSKFRLKRAVQLEELLATVAPLKKERLRLHAEMDRLQFESVIATAGDTAAAGALAAVQQDLALVERQLAPLDAQIDQLTRQFWAKRQQIVDTGYELSASRYTRIQLDDTYHASTGVILARLRALEQAIATTVDELEQVQA